MVDQPTAMNRHDRRKVETRLKLLAATERVLHRRGVSEMTVGEIAAEADLGFGTFYNYFDTKDAAVEALVAEVSGELAGQAAAVAESFGDPVDGLIAAIDHLVRWVRDNPSRADIVVGLGLAQRRLRVEIGPMLARMIDRGAQAGSFPLGADVLSPVMVGGSILAVLYGHQTELVRLATTAGLCVRALAMLGVPVAEARSRVEAFGLQPLPEHRRAADESRPAPH